MDRIVDKEEGFFPTDRIFVRRVHMDLYCLRHSDESIQGHKILLFKRSLVFAVNNAPCTGCLCHGGAFIKCIKMPMQTGSCVSLKKKEDWRTIGGTMKSSAWRAEFFAGTNTLLSRCTLDKQSPITG